MATLIYTIYLAKIWFIHRTLQTLQFRAVIYYILTTYQKYLMIQRTKWRVSSSYEYFCFILILLAQNQTF